eukprot:6047370-Lingulodinium_polyedra.AAC.1
MCIRDRPNRCTATRVSSGLQTLCNWRPTCRARSIGATPAAAAARARLTPWKATREAAQDALWTLYARCA